MQRGETEMRGRYSFLNLTPDQIFAIFAQPQNGLAHKEGI
jgi:hypothetical protein